MSVPAPNIKSLKELCAVKGYGIPTFQICENDPFMTPMSRADDASALFSSSSSAPPASIITVEVSTDGRQSGCERGCGPTFHSACEDAAARTLRNWLSPQQYDGLLSGIITAAQAIVEGVVATETNPHAAAAAAQGASASHSVESASSIAAREAARGASSPSEGGAPSGSLKRKQDAVATDEALDSTNPVSLLHMYLSAVVGESTQPEVTYQKLNMSTHACIMKLMIGTKKIESHGSASSKILAKRACCMEVMKMLYPDCQGLSEMASAVQRDMDDRKKKRSAISKPSDAPIGDIAGGSGATDILSSASIATGSVGRLSATTTMDPVVEAMASVLAAPKYSRFNETAQSFIRIRRAVADDAAAIWGLIHELAVYEREPNAVEITVDTLRRDGFCESGSKYTSPRFYVCLAVESSSVENDSAHETVVGMALFYPIYSTWKGSSMYLEDLIVREPYRGRGIGKSLIHAVGEVTLGAGFARLQWQCLKWNTKPMEFYKSLGAEPMGEWETLRMTKPAMVKTFGGVSLESAFTTINPNAQAAAKASKQSVATAPSSTWGSVFRSAEEVGATLDDNIENFLKAQKGSGGAANVTVPTGGSTTVSASDGEADVSGDEGGFSQPSKLAAFVAQHVKK